MKTEIKTSICFNDFPMHPDELSKELGVEATNIWVKGEKGKRTNKLRKNNGWKLQSELDKSEDLEKHVMFLLNKIRPIKHNFLRFSINYEPILSCVVYIYDGDRPPLNFSQEIIKELSEINASIDVDLYIL